MKIEMIEKDVLVNITHDYTVAENLMKYLCELDQKEKSEKKELQMKGIEKALELKKDGIGRYGRCKVSIPNDFYGLAGLQIHKRLTVKEVCEKLKMKRSTYYRYLKIYKNEIEERYYKELMHL